MASLTRRIFCACILLLVAVAVHVAPAWSEPAGAAANGPAVQLAMVPAPLAGDALPPPLAEPVLLCGNVWVNTTYVLSNNCQRACLNKHTPAQCATLVPICRQCWLSLQSCANNRTIPSATRCRVCTDRYAACMRPFF